MSHPRFDAASGELAAKKRHCFDAAARAAQRLSECTEAEQFLHGFFLEGVEFRCELARRGLVGADRDEQVCCFVRAVATRVGLRGFFAMRRGGNA